MVDHFKRKNSFGILYLNKEKANTDEVFGVLHKINVDIQDVYGVQQVGPSKIIVKLEDYASHKFERLIKDYEERVISVEERNVNVQIINVSSSNTVVTIKNAPFELSYDSLYNILSEYGQVYNIRTQCYTSGELAGKYNGNKTALMKLNKPIPSSLRFRRLTLLFYYKGQVRTCLKCGHEGHMAVHCNTGQFDVVNRIDETEFPELVEKSHQVIAVAPSPSTQCSDVPQVTQDKTQTNDLNGPQGESFLAQNRIPVADGPNPQSNTGSKEKDCEHPADDDALQSLLPGDIEQSGGEITEDLMDFVVAALTPINQEETTCSSTETTIMYDHQVQDQCNEVNGDSSPDGFQMNALDVEVHAAPSVDNPVTDTDPEKTWTNDHTGATRTEISMEAAVEFPLITAPTGGEGVVAAESVDEVIEDVILDNQEDGSVVEKKKKKHEKIKKYNMRHTTRDGGIRRDSVSKRKSTSLDDFQFEDIVKLGRFKGLESTGNRSNVQIVNEPITVSEVNDKCT